MEVRICHLYPDALNLYGDRGNVLCLRQRLLWRGIGVTVTPMPLGSSGSLADYDLFFIGGGQDFEQGLLLEDLARGRGDDIRAAVADGKTFLAVCGGYQMLGRSYRTWDGQSMEFLGAIDVETVGAGTREIGNFAFVCGAESGGSTVVGFENHSGRTHLGPGVQPLGRVLRGFGNNGADGTEGVRDRNVFGTYCHGPVLPKNPALCDEILRTALVRRYGAATLEPLDDSAETLAHDAALAQVMAERGPHK